MNHLQNALRLIVYNILLFAISIPILLGLTLLVSAFDICIVSDYLFVPIAIIWPWGISFQTKGILAVPMVLISVVLGCLLVVRVIGMSYYPECHDLAYQFTYKPLIWTICCGVGSYGVWMGYWFFVLRNKKV